MRRFIWLSILVLTLGLLVGLSTRRASALTQGWTTAGDLPTKTPIPLNPPTKTPIPMVFPTKTLIPIMPPTKTLIPVMQPTQTPGAMPSPTAPAWPARTLTAWPTATPEVTSTAPSESVDSTSSFSSAVLLPPTGQPMGDLPLAHSDGAQSPGTQPVDQLPNFALQHSEPPAGSVPARVSTVVDFTPIALSLLGLGAIVWLGVLQPQRALVRSLNAMARADHQVRIEAERLAHRARIIMDETRLLQVLNQAGLDATGEPLGIDQIDRVLIDPIPAIIGLGRHFERIVFTPVSPAAFQRVVKHQALIDVFGRSLRGLRPYPINAATGDLFVLDDLVAAWNYLSGKLKVSSISVPLPRSERWSIYIVPARRRRSGR